MLSHTHCPICQRQLDDLGKDPHRDAVAFRCGRCGPYTISRTALVMIKSRLEENPEKIPCVSHAIRSQTSEDNWLEITSLTVSQLFESTLPNPHVQQINLLEHLKNEVGDHHFNTIELQDQDALAAIAGSSDKDAFGKLLHWTEQEGYIELEELQSRARLLPKVWEGLDKSHSPAEQLHSKEHSKPSSTESEESDSCREQTKIRTGHCPKCGPDRRADVVAIHTTRYHDDEDLIWAIDNYRVLECRGCGSVYYEHEHFFSENETYSRDPSTGQMKTYIEPEISFWPAPAQRSMPVWLEKIHDVELQNILKEIYGALDNDYRTLAAIGARTALDRAMVVIGADGAHSFPNKIECVFQKGAIGEEEKKLMEMLTDVGSAAAHRAWTPDLEQLSTLFDGLEGFLHRTFVHTPAVTSMNENVPKRPKRSK